MLIPSGSGTQTVSTPTRILIVDDDVDAVELLSFVLKRAGHEVRATCDPLDALQLALDFQPDLAILDIGMPGASGYEVAEMFRGTATLGACRFIALTGYAYEADRRKSEAAGFHRHLTKPLDIDSLLEAVTDHGGPPSCAPPSGWTGDES